MAGIYNPRAVAQALGGHVAGRDTVLAPGPGHSAHDRSLAVRLDPAAPDGFLIYSHAGDDWRACRNHVRERLGLPAWEPGDGQQRTIPPQRVEKWDLAAVDAEAERLRPRTEDDLVRIERAVAIWNGAVDPRGTLAGKYLRSRALSLDHDVAGSALRFHSACPWRDENTGRLIFIPTLIAAFISIDDGEVTGIHRIRVDRPERWPKTDRRMLGIVSRAAIKLDPLSGDTLVIGEGVETCMAARQLGFAPVWALGSVGAISFFPLIEGVKRLVILGEAGEASTKAIKICGTRWRGAGRRVRVIMPNEGADMNDVLIAETAS
jgi:putative DNA primase/helicase